MELLLSTKAKRQLNVLELLIDYPILTLHQLSELTNYSIKTIANDLKSINEYIYPSVISTSNDGVILHIPQESSIREIYSNLLYESREYYLMYYLLNNETSSLDVIADELLVSNSTLKRIIKAINSLLKDDDIIISSNPYSVIGNEINISYFYLALLDEIWYDGNLPINTIQKEILFELSYRIMKEYQYPFSYPDIIKLINQIYIRILRIGFHHLINHELSIDTKFYPEVLDDVTFLNNFYQAFSIKLTREVLFELFKIYSYTKYVKNQADLSNIISSSKKHRCLYDSINQVLNNIAIELNINLDGTERLYLDLFNSYHLHSYTTHIIYNKSKIFNKEFFREHYKIAKTIKKNINEFYQYHIDDSFIDSLVYIIATHWPNLIKKTYENNPSINVGVYIDSHIEQSKMIANLILRYSRYNVEVIMLDLLDIIRNTEPNNGIDLLITNIPSIGVKCSEVVCIQEYPSSYDWQNILLAEERAYMKKISKIENEKNKNGY